jgi:DNA-binding IclR family transcriptional regulator
MGDSSRRYNVRAIDRALCLLSILTDGKPKNLPALSETLGISSSTTYRLLSTLESHNYVVHDKQAGGYQLGIACLELAHAYYHGSDLRLNAMPELERLRDETSETVHLGILEGMEVVYLEKLPGLHAIGLMSSRVGGRSPSYCTGLGKVLLAYQDQDEVKEYFSKTGLKEFTKNTISTVTKLKRHLKEVREQGYAIDQGEHEKEVHCVAAPLFDIRGDTLAAVSVSGPGGRIAPQVESKVLIERTKEAARAISYRLGYRSNLNEQRAVEIDSK